MKGHEIVFFHEGHEEPRRILYIVREGHEEPRRVLCVFASLVIFVDKLFVSSSVYYTLVAEPGQDEDIQARQ